MQYFFLFFLAATALTGDYNSPPESCKVLFITTNVDQMNGAANGTYLIELAVPFAAFKDAGYEIDIVSPQGGKIPIYHAGDTTAAVKATLQDTYYIQKTRNSLRPEQVNAREYDAVIIPGGYGQFWDTHTDADILGIIASIYQNGGAIGSIGHGTATLTDVKLASGKYLVKDKTMTSFPSLNERTRMSQSNFGQLLPYDMETELRKRGANLKVYDPETRSNHEVVDAKNRLVTASFASGGAFVAEQILDLIAEKN